MDKMYFLDYMFGGLKIIIFSFAVIILISNLPLTFLECGTQ